MRISDWSSDVCSSDIGEALRLATRPERMERRSASRRNGRNNRLLSATWHERVPLSGPTGCHLTMMRPSAWADRLMALSVRFVGLVIMLAALVAAVASFFYNKEIGRAHV